MRRTFLAAILALAAPAIAVAVQPEGWFLAGNDPSSYEITLDPQVAHGGAKSARLAFNTTREPKGFGTMMQSFDAADYRGKRLRFSAWVKSDKVVEWAGLWMRVDQGSQPTKTLAFDNMQNRAIKGTTDWTSYSVVLDVPEPATGVFLGILVSGKGTVWMSQASVEPVGKDVPVTDMYFTSSMKKKPANLDFEH